MKCLFKSIPFVLSLLIAVSCGNGRTEQNKAEDSNEAAEEANEEKFESGDSEKDADFVANEVAANYAEIQFAQLASQKSTDAEVKDVAKLLETEHSKSLKELQELASKKAISVPNEPEDGALRKLDNLREEKDIADFNKEWCKEMVDKHEKTIEKYEDKLEKTEDADLKAWINQTLPHLRTHLDRVKACHEKLKAAS